MQEQNVATGEISHNVASAAGGAKVVVSMLDQIAGAVSQTRSYADTVLKSLARDLDELYASTGRPSIAPERLLKASLLIALNSGSPQ